MGFLDYFKSPDINQGVAEFRNTPGALLLDVRSDDEYAAGHIPGSINLPMQRLGLIDDMAEADTKLFTYCLSGSRSRKAASILKVKGYEVSDIGGISNWNGELRRAGEEPSVSEKLKIVIVGGVAGGASAAARARRLNEQAEIVVFERSGYISYANCGLPYYIGGTISDPEELTLQTPESFYSRFRVKMHVRHEVTAIHPERKCVSVRNLESGEEFEESYDKLLLSPGARPTLPELPGNNLECLFTLRTVEDSFRIRDFVVKEQPKSVVLAGGGFIALELAENLREMGLDVTIVQRPKQLLRPLDGDMAAHVHAQFRRHGVQLKLGCEVLGFEDAENAVRVLLKDAAPLTADMVVLAIGVTPDTRLAKDAGLKLGIKGSILVNEYMETSEPDIYAVGDAVQVKHFVSGADTLLSLAGPANRQGRIAADNICGRRSSYSGSQGSAILKLFDMTAAVTGLNEAAAQSAGIDYEKVYLSPASHAAYYPDAKVMSMKVLFEKRNGRLLGAQIVGYDGVDKRIDVLATAIHAGMKAEDLAELDLAYAPPFSSAKDPVNMAGYMAENIRNGILKQFFWHDVDTLPRDGSVTLLDTRTAKEYARGHFDGFINIPVDELRERMFELEQGKKIYVNCQSGLRSYIACRILAGYGFDCYNFSGGYRVYEAVMNDKALIEKSLPCGMDK